MLVYDKADQNNTYYNCYHDCDRVVNGRNRCDKWYIPRRNNVEIDDLINHYNQRHFSNNKIYIYHVPFKIYRLKHNLFFDIVKQFKLLFNSNNLINDINEERCMFILDEHVHPSNINSEIVNLLDTVLTIVGIKKQIIILSSNHYNNNVTGKLFQCKYWNAFELAVKSIFTKEIKKDIISTQQERFMCLNSKPRAHRYFLMYNLCKIQGFKENAILSMKHVNAHTLVNCEYFRDCWSVNDIHRFTKTLPYITKYDSKHQLHRRLGDHSCGYGDTLPINLFKKFLIFIVTETEFRYKENFLFLTEKVYKPIGARMPFIIFGQPGICKYLRTLGYMTFGDIWDESYDDEPDVIKRTLKIKNLINTLCNYSINEFNDILYKCQPIVDYNFQHMQSRQPGIEIANTITDFLIH
jgi:hypothetical protein